MNAEELRTILEQHKLWLESNRKKGKRAYLRDADLRYADLRSADLRYACLCNADLSFADLSYARLSEADLVAAGLSGANLSNSDLRFAELRYADLSFADLSNAKLRYADLHRINLRYADLRGADIDYSSWPIWCGSLSPKIDRRIAAQLLYHALRAMQSCSDDPDVAAVLSNEACLRLANSFHRVIECRRIKFSGN